MCDCEREKLCRGGPQRKKKIYSNILRYSSSSSSRFICGICGFCCCCGCWDDVVYVSLKLVHLDTPRHEWGKGGGSGKRDRLQRDWDKGSCSSTSWDGYDSLCVCLCTYVYLCMCVCVLCFTISKLENRMENPLEATRSCHLLYSSDNAHWNCLAIDHNNNVLCPVISALGVSVSVSVIERCDPAARFLGQCVIWTEFQIVLDNIMKISI